MSWYKRKPKAKELHKHLPHHRSSPIADKILEQTKQTVSSKITENKTDLKSTK
jgi:hypothetical protein